MNLLALPYYNLVAEVASRNTFLTLKRLIVRLLIISLFLFGYQKIHFLEELYMKKVDTEFSFTAVPRSNRTGFWKTLSVMLAGGELGLGLTFTQFIIVILVGNLVLGLYTGALSYIAAKTGLSTHLLAKYSFGEKGSHLPSFLLGFTQVGWFGVGSAMFAVPVAYAMGWNVYA